MVGKCVLLFRLENFYFQTEPNLGQGGREGVFSLFNPVVKLDSKEPRRGGHNPGSTPDAVIALLGDDWIWRHS